MGFACVPVSLWLIHGWEAQGHTGMLLNTCCVSTELHLCVACPCGPEFQETWTQSTCCYVLRAHNKASA